ncbi:hypothetical protein D9602_00755 [Sphingomonas sp. TX0522]|nr:hypothetical protein [Sphingomonas sp. TX0522]
MTRRRRGARVVVGGDWCVVGRTGCCLSFVIPAHAGIHGCGVANDSRATLHTVTMDPGVRRDDELGAWPCRVLRDGGVLVALFFVIPA